jgi:hypothetical protein
MISIVVVAVLPSVRSFVFEEGRVAHYYVWEAVNRGAPSMAERWL